tara:strand:- start:38 stop:403 length:366 start_codon:yes stop_codon:yes gene_type:complete
MKNLLLLIIIPFLSFGQIVATESCSSVPEPGKCLAYIQTFYFNQVNSQCEESYWGGCDGVVPFWTLGDCQNSCENNSFIQELSTNKVLLKTIDILGRETTSKGFQLHIYDDGSVEKKYLIK